MALSQQIFQRLSELVELAGGHAVVRTDWGSGVVNQLDRMIRPACRGYRNFRGIRNTNDWAKRGGVFLYYEKEGEQERQVTPSLGECHGGCGS